MVTQLDWALNCLSVRLPMLFPRLQKSGKNGISTFLRSPLHWEYQRMTKGTPLGVIVRQGTEITYWRNESRTYIGITYWLSFFCQGQREVLGGVEGNRETNPRRMSTMHIATLVSISLEIFHIKYGYYVQARAAQGSKHQQTRRMNSELIRKKKYERTVQICPLKENALYLRYKIRRFSFSCVYLERLK